MIDLEWEYSRNQKMHSLSDGNCYPTEKDINGFTNSVDLWNIKAVCKLGQIHIPKEDGYDLYHCGDKIRHGKIVKKLKEHVKKIEDEIGQYNII